MADELTPAERELMVELFRLGQGISSFVLRSMGSEADLGEPTTSKEEFDLGVRMAELGAVLRVRAAQRGSVVENDYDVKGDKTDENSSTIRELGK